MKRIISLLFISLFVFTSCEDELDINTNPNNPPEISSGLALSAAQGSIATIMGGEWFNLGGIYAQYYTQAPSASQYEAIEKYNLNTDFANRTWTELYAGALNDLRFVLERSSQEGDTGTFLMATVLRAYTYQYLVDVFGDVPYAEALAGNANISPAPTAGEDIYLDLLTSLDEALDKYEENPTESTAGQQDLIFNSNIDQWVKFANTLKLKIYMRMSYTSQANSAAVTELIKEGNFLDTNASFNAFSDATAKRHPFYEVQIERFKNINHVASNSLFEFYDRNGDPRLQEVYSYYVEEEDTLYRGIEQGLGLDADLGGQKATEFSRPGIEADTPVYLMTVAESYFLQAEALVRYSGGTGAEALYNSGVSASFALHGVSGAADFTAEGGTYEYDATASQEEQIEQIIVQKWASLANVNNLEAWIEAKRTGYPVLTTEEEPAYEEGRRIVSNASVLPGNQVLLSLYYPDNEVQRNNNLDQKESLTEKVWWNQK